MIRLVEFQDIPELANIARRLAPEFFPGLKAHHDITYYHRLGGACFDSGAAFVSTDTDGVINGGVMCMKQPNLWNPSYIELNVFTIHSYGASPFVMGKMMLMFAERCQDLLDTGEINRAVVSSNAKTNVNYRRLGFKKADDRYSMESSYGY